METHNIIKINNSNFFYLGEIAERQFGLSDFIPSPFDVRSFCDDLEMFNEATRLLVLGHVYHEIKHDKSIFEEEALNSLEDLIGRSEKLYERFISNWFVDDGWTLNDIFFSFIWNDDFESSYKQQEGYGQRELITIKKDVILIIDEKLDLDTVRKGIAIQIKHRKDLNDEIMELIHLMSSYSY